MTQFNKSLYVYYIVICGFSLKATQCINQERMEDVCSEEERDRIATLFVGRNYVHYGLELGLRLTEILQIEKEECKISDRIREINRRAGSHFPDKVVTVKAVAIALFRINEGFHDFIQAINKSDADLDDWFE